MSNPSLLSPENIAKIEHLDLRARLIVEGFITGLHQSPYHGFSVEFLEHREYNPGDSVRYIDWKVFGKSDRYVIKKYEEETNLKAYLLIDSSASMAYASKKISKLEYTKNVAAALGYLLIKQQDAVGLIPFSHKLEQIIPPRSSMVHLMAIMHHVEQIIPADHTETAPLLHALAERIKKRGLIILFSDLLDDPYAVMQGLQHFRHKNHEIIIFHLLDEQELSFDFDRRTRFVDLETGKTILTAPWDIRKQYQKKIVDLQNFYRTHCRNSHIDYVPITTSTDYDVALRSYLIKRKKMQ